MDHTSWVHGCLPPQADGEQLPEVLAWFRDACDTDREAALIFPPSLSKDQRAAIHTLVQTVGLGALASVSKGLGESRHISVVRIGQEDSTSQVSRVHMAAAHMQTFGGRPGTELCYILAHVPR